MAAQDRVIACGIGPTVVGMVLRFIGAPLVMAIVSVALRLPPHVLRIVIIQVLHTILLYYTSCLIIHN